MRGSPCQEDRCKSRGRGREVDQLSEGASHRGSSQQLVHQQCSHSSVSEVAPIHRERSLSPNSNTTFFSFVSFLISIFPCHTITLPFPIIPLVLVPLPFLVLNILPSLSNLSFRNTTFRRTQARGRPLTRYTSRNTTSRSYRNIPLRTLIISRVNSLRRHRCRRRCTHSLRRSLYRRACQVQRRLRGRTRSRRRSRHHRRSSSCDRQVTRIRDRPPLVSLL